MSDFIIRLLVSIGVALAGAAAILYRTHVAVRAEERRYAILVQLAMRPDGMYVNDLAKAVGRRPGTLYPDLAALEHERRITGWFVVPADPHVQPRRTYALTHDALTDRTRT